jgi:hypothetical protein
MASLVPEFVHRSNPNGTTDSICTKCFLTVATAKWEANLDSAEQTHKCESWRVERFKKSVTTPDGDGDSNERAPTKRFLAG